MDSDICLHCNHNINETDKRMEMPCCETVYHTRCAKNMINEAIENYNNSINLSFLQTTCENTIVFAYSFFIPIDFPYVYKL